jgi:phage-related protein
MKGKILFVVGLGVGYVLGTRAGRERYEQIRKAAQSVWNTPTVQHGVGTVKDFAMTRVGDLSDTVLDGVKGFIGNATKTSGATKQDVSRAARSAKQNISKAADAAKSAVDDAASKLDDAIDDAADVASKSAATSKSSSSAAKSRTSKPAAKGSSAASGSGSSSTSGS